MDGVLQLDDVVARARDSDVRGSPSMKDQVSDKVKRAVRRARKEVAKMTKEERENSGLNRYRKMAGFRTGDYC